MKNILKNIGIGLEAGFVATWLTIASSALAQDTTIPQQREAWIDAGAYAKTHEAVGIAVYGRTNDMSNEEIASVTKKYWLMRLAV